MDFGISQKRALVLGGSRGLGQGLALALAGEGVDVAIVGRNRETLDAVAASASGLPGRLAPVAADLSEAGAAERVRDAAYAALGGIDIFVGNGGGPPPGPISAVDGDAWRRHFDTMAARLFELTGELLPAMRERQWGRLIVIASSGVRQPIPHLGISNTIRAGIVAWMKTLAEEIAPDGVTANTLLPGRIATERVAELDAAAAKRQGVPVDQVASQSKSRIPAGRYGRVEEFAAVGTFLASEAASYVTGATIPVDGGLIRSL